MLPARLPTIRTTHWRLRKSALIVSGRGWPSSTTIRLGVSVHGGAAAFQDSVRARGMVVLPGGLINITEDDFNSGKVHARDILEQLRAASAKVIVLVVQPKIQRALYAWSFDNDVLYGPGFGWISFWPGEDALHNADGGFNASALQGAEGLISTSSRASIRREMF